MTTDGAPQHVVGIVGGAVAGSAAAELLADRGIAVVVIEQNERPYGKIEDGLPRWHSKQRRMEYGKIDARLSRPNVHVVPATKLGRDVSFLELAHGWGLSALLLANGAWRDRKLEVPGVDELLGRGLAYQNPFIQWFNHKNERTYGGEVFEIPDTGVVVVGGGLASIDVAKVVQLELYGRALERRGIKTDMYELEHEGIPSVLEKHGIADAPSLGVKDAVLIYRRRGEDMPLAQEPDDATPEQKRKTEATRRKILDKVREKFLFRFEERRLPFAPIVEGGRLRGLVVRETAVQGRKVSVVPGSERELRADLVVSSIGSVPERIDGVAMSGEYYDYKDAETGEYAGLPGVFGIGNAVTGQGNIRVSMVHGQAVARHLLEGYLGAPERDAASPGGRYAPTSAPSASGRYAAPIEHAQMAAARVDAYVRRLDLLPAERVGQILERVRALQHRVGYTDYPTWVKAHTPPDLE